MFETKFPSQLQLRIDWSELDYFGHVNNVSFFKYIQAARVNYWDQIGITQQHLDTNIGPMLASCNCDFKLPLFYPGNCSIITGLAFIKTTSFGFHHKILNAKGQLAAEAKDVMVMYDFNKNEKVEITEALRNKFYVFENFETKK